MQTGKGSLNTAYQTEHIAIKLQNTRHITQTVNCFKLFKITELKQLIVLNEKNMLLVSDGGSTSQSVSTMLPKHLSVRSLSIQTEIHGMLKWGESGDVQFVSVAF